MRAYPLVLSLLLCSSAEATIDISIDDAKLKNIAT